MAHVLGDCPLPCLSLGTPWYFETDLTHGIAAPDPGIWPGICSCDLGVIPAGLCGVAVPLISAQPCLVAPLLPGTHLHGCLLQPWSALARAVSLPDGWAWSRQVAGVSRPRAVLCPNSSQGSLA